MNDKIKHLLRTYARHKAERERAWLEQEMGEDYDSVVAVRLEAMIERVTFDCWAFFVKAQQNGDLDAMLVERLDDPEQADVERGTARPRQHPRSWHELGEQERRAKERKEQRQKEREIPPPRRPKS